MGKDYLPSKESDLLFWSLNFAKCLNEYAEELKLDPQKVKAFEALAVKYKNAVEKTSEPGRTCIDTKAKSEIRKKLQQSVRQMVTADLNYNENLTPETRKAMLLNEKAAARSQSSQRPADKPLLELELAMARISVMYRNARNGKKSKPQGVRGITFRWDILDDAPANLENLTRIVSKTSGPLILDFKESERGKAFYIASSWESARGEAGPWSDITKIYIA